MKKQKGITFGYCDEVTGQRVYIHPSMNGLLPEQRPPPLKEHKPVDDHGMFAKITCTPALGQPTTIARDQKSVHFSVLLETNSPSRVDNQDVQVCIWHNHGDLHQWSELRLQQSNDFDDTLLANNDTNLSRRWYTAELANPPSHSRPLSFTIKFKLGTDSGWKWIQDQTGLANGQLHYLKAHTDRDLSHYFQCTSPELQVRREKAETSDTTLFTLAAPVQPAAGEKSGYTLHTLGTPTDYVRWFSLVRLWSPWLAPRQGKEYFKLDRDGVLVSFLRDDGQHVVCLAVSGIDDVLTIFKDDGHGNVVIQGRNDRKEQGTARIVVAVADSFEVANSAVMHHARNMIMNNSAMTVDMQQEEKELTDKHVKAEWLEEWYDGLTYCTWNALGQNLTEKKIYDALDTLEKDNITITNLIIDDNWQSVTEADSQMNRAWIEFEANKEGFPQGLKHTISEIRTKHPKINHIAVWHAILGYWGGVSPHGQIAKDYKTRTVRKEAGVAEGDFTVVDAPDVQRMYNDFYSFLSSCGITSVKTDAQFFLDMLDQAPARRDLITLYQDAWTIAHLRHFSSRAISCMSQNPQILFHSQLPTNKPRLLVRNSDDFFPEIDASHPWHIFCNAHNSLLTQHLNVLPDWDMFQTSHPYAAFHAAARCVSGGPIYFTDYPGQHDITLIRQMTAQTMRGRTVILRPDTVGRSTSAYVGYDDTALLKIATYHGRAGTGTSILGIFNCTAQPLSELIRLEDFSGTNEGVYVVRSFAGKVSKPMARDTQAAARTAVVGVDVASHGWDILAAHPVRTFATSKHDALGVANLGLVGKMTGAAAVTGYETHVEGGGRLRLWVGLKALGVLGLYIQGLGRISVQEDLFVVLFGKPIAAHCVRVSGDCEEVLEIDVQRAWEESGGNAGWSNDVSLEVFVS